MTETAFEKTSPGRGIYEPTVGQTLAYAADLTGVDVGGAMRFVCRAFYVDVAGPISVQLIHSDDTIIIWDCQPGVPYWMQVRMFDFSGAGTVATNITIVA